jgi:hypothetical protein
MVNRDEMEGTRDEAPGRQRCNDPDHTRYPNLTAFLTWNKSIDGRTAIGGEVKIEATNGALLVTLLDHFQGRQTNLAVKQWDDLAAVLDLALLDGNTVWRPYLTKRKPFELKSWQKRT